MTGVVLLTRAAGFVGRQVMRAFWEMGCVHARWVEAEGKVRWLHR